MSANIRRGTSLKQFLKRWVAVALVAAVGCAGTTSYQKAKEAKRTSATTTWR